MRELPVIPKVSVVNPCLNEKGWIGPCLDSVLANNYPKDSLEILVVDGMSKDGTREIISDYIKRFPDGMIKLLDNVRKTQEKALNIGISHAVGDVIVRLDARAMLSKEYISICTQYLREYKAGSVGGRFVTLPQQESLMGKSITIALSEPFGVGNSFRVKKNGKPEWVDTAPYACYHREVFERLGLYREGLEYSEDAEFHQRMKRNGYKTLLIPDIASYYFARSDLKSFFIHAVRNGIWAILPAKYTGYLVVSLRHLVPLAFVSSIVASGLLALVLPEARTLLASIVGAYWLTSLAFSALIAIRQGDFRYAFTMPLVFGTLHLGYGLGSLIGLMKLSFSLFSRLIPFGGRGLLLC